MVNSDFLFKVCIFGDGGVGKTTLIDRYLTGKFRDDLKMTIGINLQTANVILSDNRKVTLSIWDFAGEERFRTFFDGFVNGSKLGILMFSLDQYISFKNLNKWIDKCIRYEFPLILVGGKCDSEQSINKDDINKFIDKNKERIILYIECSSKTGENIDYLFYEILNILVYNDSKVYVKEKCINTQI